jgi:hypothetical protein
MNPKIAEAVEVLESLEQFTGGTAKERLLLAISILKNLEEEKIAGIITDILVHTPIAGDWDRTRAVYANDMVAKKIHEALLTQLTEG